jgi:hypothetical protein
MLLHDALWMNNGSVNNDIQNVRRVATDCDFIGEAL